MPLYMDVHDHLPDGATFADVAGAHKLDVETQDKHGVTFIRYWVDEENGTAFCLVDAPSPEAANDVHREAHGLLADRHYLVVEGS